MTLDTHMGRPCVGVVGAGRLGSALAAALRDAGYPVDGPARRGQVPAGDAILICVPDDEIPNAAATVGGAAPLVGHTSGATPLSALSPAARTGAALFGLHPLQTLSQEAADFEGAGCAIAGTTDDARGFARRLAADLGMTPFEIDDQARPAYHAAASIASNFLVTLEAAAERMAVAAGLEPPEARRLLGPLVRRSVENWAQLGPEAALTGPIARGDEGTVELQRRAVATEAPELLDLFDELARRTRALARHEVPA
jgi:predicted short-subunit dehydrogenase-like oxidoreductase (DUF2520 family)